MKKIILIFMCVFGVVNINAQISNSSNTKNTVVSPDSNVNFRLYQTNNFWTFIKLDTRTGELTQVQYGMYGKSERMQYTLSDAMLATGEDAKTGRFFLYPTENTYNFILLDQIDGRVWQVQWSFEEENRGIIRI